MFFVIWGCSDLVKEDASTSGCESALNDRDYDTALEKCSARKDRATSYMGKAGFDVINLLNSSSKSTTAITDVTITALLGTENVSFVTALNTLNLTTDVYPDEADRENAIETAKVYLESVIDLYDGVTNQTTEELVLQTFGTLYATNLELLLLLDVGMATSLDITSASFSTDLLASGGKILITGDSSIPSSSVAVSTYTFADSTSSVDNIMKKLDGRIWANEQNLALMIESIGLSAATQLILGTSSSTIQLYGNLPSVCRSFSNTKTSSDPAGKAILTLLTDLTNVISQFNSAFSGSSSDTTSSISELDAAVATFETSIDSACKLVDSFSSI
ncbi:MAG: hypothetical protein HQM13_09445 [SAR324 cluster bacterium]|nr:hypothetical protein [SAR324 cluster bacterium]